jgi:hypothetical protein
MHAVNVEEDQARSEDGEVDAPVSRRKGLSNYFEGVYLVEEMMETPRLRVPVPFAARRQAQG